MSKTLIFLSGFAVPTWLSKTKFVWNDPFWEDYHRVYIDSKTPRSDNMVDRELARLSNLINSYDNPIVIGQSLGGWWGANLACYPGTKMDKLVLWTPVCHAEVYPIFNVTLRHHPMAKHNNPNMHGPHRVLISYAYDDWLVPHDYHAVALMKKFNATLFRLDGGHWFQTNHQQGLSFMKDWIEL